ncbi:MAG: hypothetical protein JO197_09480 [Acidobacteria bacterium]|nr:hypothetical protein [Acidobacteriota bacterium]MBV9477327.1 hypothetical protein [Acidobacteriota bacterium]
MISCEAFRTRFHASTEDPSLLDHLRACDRCLDFAVDVDPDVLFRSLGGAELVPPGGVDAFVSDVMRQVRVRDAETAAAARHRVISWPRRLAIAATIAAGLTGTLLTYRANAPTVAPQPIARIAHASAPVAAKALVTKPVVETYDSQNATIVEVPGESSDDVKVVMIFDENLPADL